eukprot:9857032-Prorocentrum_lima.AAC.1
MGAVPLSARTPSSKFLSKGCPPTHAHAHAHVLFSGGLCADCCGITVEKYLAENISLPNKLIPEFQQGSKGCMTG